MVQGGGRHRKYLIPILIIILLSLPTAGINTKPINASASSPTDINQPLTNMANYVSVKDGAKDPLIYSKAYILLDADSAKILSSDNENQQVPIASTTKMMTALVARENFKLDDIVTIDKQVNSIPETTIGLIPGETITVGDLLKGMLIPSGNDAAYSLAYHYDQLKNPDATKPDYHPFVELMNAYATSHNLLDTHYGDPAGLDDTDGHSTAFDLANIARLVLQDPVLAAIVGTPSTSVSSTDGKHIHNITNSDRLIIPSEPLYMPGVIGIKTGLTDGAGHCLVGAYKLGDRTLIGVVLNTNVYTAQASAVEMRKLFVWASQSLQVNSY